jgi:hypothetical protein
VDHRGEEVSLLADAVWVWEEAAARGPATIAQEVAAGDRGRGGRRWTGPAGNDQGNGNGHGNGYSRPAPAAAATSMAPPPSMPAPSVLAAPSVAAAPSVPAVPKIRVSPLRGGGVTPFPATTPDARGAGMPAVEPAASEPLAFDPAPDDLAAFAPEREEPPLPEEARAVAARASAAPTVPLEAPLSGILNVRFTRGADAARIVLAMEELRAMLRARPGSTRVVFHLPGPGGATLPMEVRSMVAYDAELLAEVQRRLGEGLVRLELSSGGLS